MFVNIKLKFNNFYGKAVTGFHHGLLFLRPDIQDN